MSLTVNTSVDLDAPKQMVWDVLTNFAAYPEWNLHMQIEGMAEVGTKLKVQLAGGRRGMTFRPTVLAVKPGVELRWIGRLAFGGIFDGEHFFILDRSDDGTTHLTHGERYSGALVAMAKPFLNFERSEAGYEKFNRDLKRRIDSLRKQQ
jgi:hypothetical protein